ncbi:MAG TPA: RluA family pseudouridine synthase, partial [Tepidisphaeraceae bacterium]|nr:RluA family pseudouridine synthase [Tepidisphaeraceae bacterium]
PVPSAPAMLLMDWLITKYPTAKRTTLRQMVEQGRVSINGQPARTLKVPVGETDKVQVDQRPERTGPSLSPLELIHEDEDILVINKPAGLLTSTTPKEPRPTAIAVIRKYLATREPRARAGVIHRLDRDASGLLVFSKNNDAYESLKQQFFKHSVERVYTAVIHGVLVPPAGRIESDLVELPDGTVRTTRIPTKGQHAITDYQTLKTAGGIGGIGNVSLLRVTLQTGRKHQIRTHLAQKGHPIVGDPVYGDVKDDKSRLLLAATTLSLDHPRTGQRLTFEIPLPAEIRAVIKE